jgi:hypothetical protein
MARGLGIFESCRRRCFFVLTFFSAYLTNPSENSFRAYLTEQSFRHHLSRLDDTSDEQETRDKVGSSQRRGTPSSSTVPFDHGSPFHFANRATVSLRTPKHVFHSFGIFTVAAIIPARADRGRSRRDRDSSTIVTDSWFIGAFGKWYRGGVLDAWYQDVVARSSDEESWTSGIMGMKALDKLNEYDGTSKIDSSQPKPNSFPLRPSFLYQESARHTISSQTEKPRKVVAAGPGSELEPTAASEICLVAFAHPSALSGRASACLAAEYFLATDLGNRTNPFELANSVPITFDDI